MTILVLTSLPDANPSNPPAGWFKPAAANPGRILAGDFSRSSGTIIAVWLDNTVYSGNTLSAKFTHGANATQAGNASCRVLFLNSSQNGYCLWLDQLGTEARIYKVILCALDATPIATFTSYGTGYSQNFEFRCVNKTTGTFQFLRNNVQIGSDVIDTTYTGLTNAGIGVNGGKLRGTIEVSELYTVNSITNPVVMGGVINVGTSGYSNVTSITTSGMSATGISFSSGSTSGNWPAIVEGLVSTIALPATNITFSVSDGSTVRTINSDIDLATNFLSTEFGIVLSEPACINTVYPLDAGWYCYYDGTQLGGSVVYPDSTISYVTDGIFTCYIHQLGDDNTVYELNLDLNSGASPDPDPFTFTPQIDVPINSIRISNTITISGLPALASSALSIVGGEYSKNGGAYSSANGSVVNTDTLTLRQTSSSSYLTLTTATVTTGTYSTDFEVTTEEDLYPDNIVFESFAVLSSIETLSGITGSLPISITGGQYSKNGGAFTSASGTVTNGDTLQLYVEVTSTVVLTIGSLVINWAPSNFRRKFTITGFGLGFGV